MPPCRTVALEMVFQWIKNFKGKLFNNMWTCEDFWVILVENNWYFITPCDAKESTIRKSLRFKAYIIPVLNNNLAKLSVKYELKSKL